MPRELVCVGINQLQWREYAEPALSAGQVRIRCRFAAAKHGTEMAMFKGYAFPRGGFDRQLGVFRKEQRGNPFPFAVGNMVVGEVTESAGDVTDVKVGQRVLTYGGFRQTLVRPAAECWKIPPDLPWQSAVCQDPAEFALGAVRDGNVRIGDAVAVFGLGAIGLMVVQLVRLAGAGPIVAVDPVGARRQVAAKLGAALTLDPTACDAGIEIRKAAAGRGADVVIEYSGSRLAMQDALRGVAYGGTVVAGAFPPPYDAGLDFGAEAHLNIPRIVFSRACSQPDRDHPRWTQRRIQETCLRLLIEGRLTGLGVVEPIVPFDQALEAYLKIPKGEGIKLGTIVQ